MRSYDPHNGVCLSKKDPSPHILPIQCPQSAERERKKKIERENIPRILRSSHPAYVMPADKRRKGASALMHRACIVRPHYWIRGAESSTRDPAGNKKTTGSVPAVLEGGRGFVHSRWCVRVRCTRRGTRFTVGREMDVAIPMGEGRHRVSAGPAAASRGIAERQPHSAYGVRVEHVAINNLLRREGRSLQRHTLARILSPSSCLVLSFFSPPFSLS